MAICKVNSRYSNFNFNSIEVGEICHYTKNTSASKLLAFTKYLSGIYFFDFDSPTYDTVDRNTFNYGKFLIEQILADTQMYDNVIDKYKPLYEIFEDYLSEIRFEFKKYRLYGDFVPPDTSCRSAIARFFISDDYYKESARAKYNEKRSFEEQMLQERIFKPDFPSVSLKLTANSPWGYKESEVVYDFGKIIKCYERALDKVGKQTFIRAQRALITDSIRYDVLSRDGFRCKICGATAADGVKLEVDHIIPVSKGGRSTIDNLQTLCERCNRGKRDKLI